MHVELDDGDAISCDLGGCELFWPKDKGDLSRRWLLGAQHDSLYTRSAFGEQVAGRVSRTALEAEGLGSSGIARKWLWAVGRLSAS